MADDFIKDEGLPFLAHLLRRLSDEFVRGCADWYPEVGVTIPPRTASTLLLLEKAGPSSVTEIASAIRQSHPLVITWIEQLRALGFVMSLKDLSDRRRTLVSLTARGKGEVERLRHAQKAVESAHKQLLKEAGADVFDALWRIEEACRREPFSSRLARQRNAKPESNFSSPPSSKLSCS